MQVWKGTLTQASSATAQQQVAVKRIDCVGAGVKGMCDAVREVLMVHALDSSYLVKQVGAIKHADSIDICLEHHAFRDLFHLLHDADRRAEVGCTQFPPPLHRRFEWLSQIGGALERCHAHRVLCRDLTSKNVLVALDHTAKVADLGLLRAAALDASSMLVRAGPCPCQLPSALRISGLACTAMSARLLQVRRVVRGA